MSKQRPRKKLGRPSLDADHRRDRRLRVSMTAEEEASYCRAASASGKPLPLWARDVMDAAAAGKATP